jgi:hypothetical protein
MTQQAPCVTKEPIESKGPYPEQAVLLSFRHSSLRRICIDDLIIIPCVVVNCTKQARNLFPQRSREVFV